MFARFLLAILLPRVVAAAIAVVAIGRFGETGLIAIPIAVVVCLIWTFVSVTGGTPYRRPKLPAPVAKPEPATEKEAPEVVALVLIFIIASIGIIGVMGLLAILEWIFATAAQHDWKKLTPCVAATDAVLAVILLWWCNGFQSFVRAEASREVHRFHARYQHIIGDEYPLAVVDAELLSVGSDASPAQKWGKANELLRGMKDAVRKVCEERAQAAREAERRAAEAAAAAEAERKAREKAAAAEIPFCTPPIESDPEPEPPKPAEPGPDARAEMERERERLKENAMRMGLPLEILAAELERFDEDFRKRFGGKS